MFERLITAAEQQGAHYARVAVVQSDHLRQLQDLPVVEEAPAKIIHGMPL